MLEKKYNHIYVEKGKYDFWLKNNFFKSGDLTKEPFTIVIPPPNVTGKLHLGHAWDTALQDAIIRYKRMCGYDALWLPGMDHAGIATQAKIDKKLKSEGINPRLMKRDEWLKIAWEWKSEYALNIHNQWAKLGLSLDYSKERFTLDKGLNKAVNKVFIDFYNKGLIYKGEKIINWDPEAMTALSNEEVIYKDVKGFFYHIKYMIDGTNDYLEIATTRPETMFGDTAVAVNPKDDRYKDLIGKKVSLPIVNKLIPIIGDIHADMEFGTGVVKITPAHDPNDFEVGNRHNLERIIVIEPNGKMNEKALKYNGMDRLECRKKVVEDLEKMNLLIKTEPITHNVGYSERTDVPVEPYLSKQWFVKMRPLANRVLLNQKDKNNKVNFVPERFEKVMNHWMEITYDWCISRQLWWGHRIPAWYKNSEIKVQENCPGEGWIQDTDVLDTWFSSALWPFSTLGWPTETDDFKRYYPNDVLMTAYDIIPFWVNRMTFQGLEWTNSRPFKECIIHGLIRDKEGRKMSKSLGNGIDPMDVIEEYGCDALRYFLITSSAMGMDLRFDNEKVKSTWNFINKIWNASRYVLMNVNDFEMKDWLLNNLNIYDKWILTKLNKTIKEVKKHMDKYEFNMVGSTLYDFIWNDYCDNYIELSKFNSSNSTKTVLLKVLMDIIKLLHPIMPYVTEEIYQLMPNKNNSSIMISDYPIYDKNLVFNSENKIVDDVLEFITMFRNKRQELNISDYYVEINISNAEIKNMIINMLKLSDKQVFLENKTNFIIIKLNDLNIKLFYDNSKNILEEKNNLEKEKERLLISIERRNKLLSNKGYLAKAPQNIVENEKSSLQKEKERMSTILETLKKL